MDLCMTLRNEPQALFLDGRFWAVSPLFWKQSCEGHFDLLEEAPENVRELILRLLAHSEDTPLTDDERERLQVLTRHHNVRNAIKFLQGRSIADFGMEYFDQVHGLKGTFDCGCSLHWVFDHYLARAIGSDVTPELVVNGVTDFECHPHYPAHVCKSHRHLVSDLAALHDAVRADADLVPAGKA